MKTFEELLNEGKREEMKPKLTKAQKELLNFIENQISIPLFDLVHYFTNKKVIMIDMNGLNLDELMLIESLGKTSGRYKIETNNDRKLVITPT